MAPCSPLDKHTRARKCRWKLEFFRDLRYMERKVTRDFSQYVPPCTKARPVEKCAKICDSSISTLIATDLERLFYRPDRKWKFTVDWSFFGGNVYGRNCFRFHCNRFQSEFRDNRSNYCRNFVTLSKVLSTWKRKIACFKIKSERNCAHVILLSANCFFGGFRTMRRRRQNC